jgi:hypothetical protein
MIMRDEQVQKITGQQAQTVEKDGRKPLRETLTGNHSQNTDIFTIEELRGYFNPGIYETRTCTFSICTA